MAGIFGFLNRSDSFNPQSLAKTLSDYAKNNFDYPSNYILFDNKRSCLGFAAPFIPDSWPLRSKDDNFIFQLFGEIFLPDGSLLSATNFDHDFLNPFIDSPDNFLKKIDGNFIFALYDKVNKTYYLCNDPFGNFAVHYCNREDLFVFSSQIHGISAACREKQWDKRGWEEYIGLGYTLNGKTYYNNVKRLQPSEIITVTPHRIKSKIYHTPHYQHTDQVRENILTIRNSVLSSIKKRLQNYDSVGAALTGGFDSRVTWAIINKLNYKDQVTAFTHGLKESRDITTAKRIADKLELEHIVKIFDDPFINELPMNWQYFVNLTEGMVSVTAASALDSWKLGGQHYTVLLDSHGGALFRRQFMKVAEKKIINTDHFSDQIFDLVKSPLLNFNLLDEEVKQSAISSSRQGLKEYFDSLNQIEHPGDKLDLFYIHAISGNRYSFAGNAQMNWVQLAHPFLNLESFNAVQKIPLRYRRNHSIYRYIVNSTYPVLKSFYLENMGLPVPYYGFIYLRYIPMIYELLLQKTIRLVGPALYNQLSLRKFVSNYDTFFRINAMQVKEILLRENNNFSSFINRSKLELFLKDIFNDEATDTTQLSNLITLKLFYDNFHHK
jgi:hypothetical protein